MLDRRTFIKTAIGAGAALYLPDSIVRAQAIPFPGPGMPHAATGFSLIDHIAAGSSAGNGISTATINTTGANLIVVGVAYFAAGGAPTISDSKGNSWSDLTPEVNTVASRLSYSVPTSVGSGHTFSASGTGNFPAICVAAFSGALSTPFDNVANNHTSSPDTSLFFNPFTPSQNNELIVCSLGFDTSNTVSIDSGFTIRDQINWSGGAHEGCALAYLIQGTAGSLAPTWSWSSTATAATEAAWFKAA